ncbi:MAG: hypothetical protein AB7H77_02125 [Bdellovibrionales bacterium]
MAVDSINQGGQGADPSKNAPSTEPTNKPGFRSRAASAAGRAASSVGRGLWGIARKGLKWAGIAGLLGLGADFAYKTLWKKESIPEALNNTAKDSVNFVTQTVPDTVSETISPGSSETWSGHRAYGSEKWTAHADAITKKLYDPKSGKFNETLIGKAGIAGATPAYKIIKTEDGKVYMLEGEAVAGSDKVTYPDSADSPDKHMHYMGSGKQGIAAAANAIRLLKEGKTSELQTFLNSSVGPRPDTNQYSMDAVHKFNEDFRMENLGLRPDRHHRGGGQAGYGQPSYAGGFHPGYYAPAVGPATAAGLTAGAAVHNAFVRPLAEISAAGTDMVNSVPAFIAGSLGAPLRVQPSLYYPPSYVSVAPGGPRSANYGAIKSEASPAAAPTNQMAAKSSPPRQPAMSFDALNSGSG